MPPEIVVLAGVNGAGKSSVAGAAFEAVGGTYYNPDRATRMLIDARFSPDDANARAWRRGVDQIAYAIQSRTSYVFETTLGGRTVTRHLLDAAASGLRVRIWYVGLASPEKHLERVKARVLRGGHDIPEARIRARWMSSRENLVRLLPSLYEIALFDNSQDARVDEGEAPSPRMLAHARGGTLLDLSSPKTMPSWARPIVTALLRLRSVDG